MGFSEIMQFFLNSCKSDFQPQLGKVFPPICDQHLSEDIDGCFEEYILSLILKKTLKNDVPKICS